MLYKKIDKIIIVVAIASILIGSAVILTHNVNATPYFSSKSIKKMGGKPDGKIVGVIKSDPNCPPEFYARATPKNNNHVLLNKEDIVNDGPMHKFSWYYDVLKIKATSDTNEGKIRTYVVGVDVFDKQTGEVVTHYKSIQVGKKTVDLGVFDMRGTNLNNCAAAAS